MKKIGHVVLCFLLISCGGNDKEIFKSNSNQQKLAKAIKEANTFISDDKVISESVECERKQEKGKIVLNSLINDTLNLEVLFWDNCSLEGGFVSYVKSSKDTLKIGVSCKGCTDVELNEAGELIYSQSITDCDCLFRGRIKIKDIEVKPKVIYVNGYKPSESHRHFINEFRNS